MGTRASLADRPPDPLELAGQLELVAGFDKPFEAHVVDAGEEREAALVLLLGEHGHSAGLGHGLDDQDPGHDRAAGKVSLEVPLVLAHGLARDGTDALLQLDDLVDEEERLTMGQDRLDLCPPERRLKAGCHEPPSLVTMDALTAENVVPRLRGRFGHPYLYAETCPSTQRLLTAEQAEGAVAVTEEQTEGRGRLGRTWASPPRVSILCSVLLEPPVETSRLPELSVVAGEACAEAISRVTGLEPRVKLPNDVLLGERKVAGILAETRDGRVVLGLGINVNLDPAELPLKLNTPATSLLAELGRTVDRAELLVTLLESLEERYDRWLPQ
jgi:biotin-[acetyl-CoA-carboxylase] ligase BirA-like protein